MKPLGWKIKALGHEARNKPSLDRMGWRVRKYPPIGEVFFLTSPFIELIRTWLEITVGRMI
jgi:hypothetical protein